MRITNGIITKELDNLSVIFFHKTNKNNSVHRYDKKSLHIFNSVAMEMDVILKRSSVLIECLGCKTLLLRLQPYFLLKI